MSWNPTVKDPMDLISMDNNKIVVICFIHFCVVVGFAGHVGSLVLILKRK